MGLESIPVKIPKRWRTWMGPFRVYEEGHTLPARASLEVARRGALRLNLYVELFSVGKFPHYSRHHQQSGYTVRLPLQTVLRLAEWVRASGVKIRYQESQHKWREHFEDLVFEVPRLGPAAKVIASKLQQSRNFMREDDWVGAAALYREAREEFKKATLETFEQERLLKEAGKLARALKKAKGAKP